MLLISLIVLSISRLVDFDRKEIEAFNEINHKKLQENCKIKAINIIKSFFKIVILTKEEQSFTTMQSRIYLERRLKDDLKSF